MIRLVYNLLFPFALLLFLPGYVQKMRRRGNYKRNAGQRLGFYSGELRARFAAHPHTWIHAVSVGEVAIALKLARKLREVQPQFRCVITTTTTTGYAFAEREADEWMSVMYNPIDFWLITRRAFGVMQPERIILVEAEVWPNLAAEAHHRRVPIALVNARLSQRSERRFRRFEAFVRPTFRCLDLVCVQEAKDIARWQALGVRPEVIRNTGSIKYDPSETQMDARMPQDILRSLGVATTRPIVLGGSTHAGEEEILARAFLQLRKAVPNDFLIVAPRHAERANEVATALEALGLRIARRSNFERNSDEVDCLLLDTTGELRHWYGTATVVFIGKSLTTHGGQNPVEPIIAGKPVVFGPHMENFATLARALIDARAAVQIRAAEELAPALLDLLRDDARREGLVRRAHEVLAPHRGATQRTAELLLQMHAGGGGANSLA
ncbi:MAG: 3-deoxy-D-manno-octulosonic acid transferase [Chthoniobacterales bacterium]